MLESSGVVLRTLRDLHALHRLVVHRSGAFLDQFISFDADIKDLCALDAQSYKLLYSCMYNLSSSLDTNAHLSMVRSVYMGHAEGTQTYLVLGKINLCGRARLLLNYGGFLDLDFGGWGHVVLQMLQMKGKREVEEGERRRWLPDF